jgi:hypothetical protein
MARTETATLVSIMVNGKTVKLTAKDALIFAWHVTQAAEFAVEEAGEAYVALETSRSGGMSVRASALQEMVGCK